MGLEPSKTAFLLRNSCSSPLASFHDTTVAPKRLTMTESPEASDAWTLSSSTEIEGCGRGEETGMAVGLFARSMMVVVLVGWV